MDHTRSPAGPGPSPSEPTPHSSLADQLLKSDSSQACATAAISAPWHSMQPSGSSVVSCLDNVPVTVERPPPFDLSQYIDRPGVVRACEAADRFHPRGHELTPMARTSLQQHFDYFDMNKDGMITPYETFTTTAMLHLAPGILNYLVSAFVTLAIHMGLFYLTQDSWIPDPRLIIYTKNAHRTVHGSTSNTWDREGRFSPQHFESILSKFDRNGKGGLSPWELLMFVKSRWNLMDIAGIMATTGEWFLTWLIFRDPHGVLRREDMRGMFDGTAFYRMAERNGYRYGIAARRRAVEQHNMG